MGLEIGATLEIGSPVLWEGRRGYVIAEEISGKDTGLVARVWLATPRGHDGPPLVVRSARIGNAKAVELYGREADTLRELWAAAPSILEGLPTELALPVGLSFFPRVHDRGHCDGDAWFVEDRAPGERLDELIVHLTEVSRELGDATVLPEDQALWLAFQLATVVRINHSIGQSCWDALKPDAIWVPERWDRDPLMLVDWNGNITLTLDERKKDLQWVVLRLDNMLFGLTRTAEHRPQPNAPDPPGWEHLSPLARNILRRGLTGDEGDPYSGAEDLWQDLARAAGAWRSEPVDLVREAEELRERVGGRAALEHEYTLRLAAEQRLARVITQGTFPLDGPSEGELQDLRDENEEQLAYCSDALAADYVEGVLSPVLARLNEGDWREGLQEARTQAQLHADLLPLVRIVHFLEQIAEGGDEPTPEALACWVPAFGSLRRDRPEDVIARADSLIGCLPEGPAREHGERVVAEAWLLRLRTEGRSAWDRFRAKGALKDLDAATTAFSDAEQWDPKVAALPYGPRVRLLPSLGTAFSSPQPVSDDKATALQRQDEIEQDNLLLKRLRLDNERCLRALQGGDLDQAKRLLEGIIERALRVRRTLYDEARAMLALVDLELNLESSEDPEGLLGLWFSARGQAEAAAGQSGRRRKWIEGWSARMRSAVADRYLALLQEGEPGVGFVTADGASKPDSDGIEWIREAAVRLESVDLVPPVWLGEILEVPAAPPVPEAAQTAPAPPPPAPPPPEAQTIVTALEAGQGYEVARSRTEPPPGEDTDPEAVRSLMIAAQRLLDQLPLSEECTHLSSAVGQVGVYRDELLDLRGRMEALDGKVLPDDEWSGLLARVSLVVAELGKVLERLRGFGPPSASGAVEHSTSSLGDLQADFYSLAEFGLKDHLVFDIAHRLLTLIESSLAPTVEPALTAELPSEEPSSEVPPSEVPPSEVPPSEAPPPEEPLPVSTALVAPAATVPPRAPPLTPTDPVGRPGGRAGGRRLWKWLARGVTLALVAVAVVGGAILIPIIFGEESYPLVSLELEGPGPRPEVEVSKGAYQGKLRERLSKVSVTVSSGGIVLGSRPYSGTEALGGPLLISISESPETNEEYSVALEGTDSAGCLIAVGWLSHRFPSSVDVPEKVELQPVSWSVLLAVPRRQVSCDEESIWLLFEDGQNTARLSKMGEELWQTSERLPLSPWLIQYADVACGEEVIANTRFESDAFGCPRSSTALSTFNTKPAQMWNASVSSVSARTLSEEEHSRIARARQGGEETSEDGSLDGGGAPAPTGGTGGRASSAGTVRSSGSGRSSDSASAASEPAEGGATGGGHGDDRGLDGAEPDGLLAAHRGSVAGDLEGHSEGSGGVVEPEQAAAGLLHRIVRVCAHEEHMGCQYRAAETTFTPQDVGSISKFGWQRSGRSGPGGGMDPTMWCRSFSITTAPDEYNDRGVLLWGFSLSGGKNNSCDCQAEAWINRDSTYGSNTASLFLRAVCDIKDGEGGE